MIFYIMPSRLHTYHKDIDLKKSIDQYPYDNKDQYPYIKSQTSDDFIAKWVTSILVHRDVLSNNIV